MDTLKFTERKSIRRLLITMVFCFLMCLVPLCAHGAEYTDEGGITWSYTIAPEGGVYPYAGTVLIKECVTIPEDGIVKIPASINGVEVTGIESHAFNNSNKDAILEIVLPEGFKQIGAYAFRACPNLKTVQFPESLDTIEQGAFDSCRFESLEFPANLHCTIKAGAFGYNPALQTVTINGNVTFSPSAGSVFNSCSNGPGTGLRAFEVSESNNNYTVVDGVLYSKDMTRLEDYPTARAGETYIVPDGVQIICAYAFQQNSLKSVALPETLTEIGDSAFQNSWKLTTIEIPAGVKKLGTSCFNSSNVLKNVTLHEGLEAIGGFAFFGCGGMYEVELPDGLTTIGERAFSGMAVLQKVYIPDSVTEIGANAFQTRSNPTIYTTNETAATYAQENGVSCETATVEEYRAVEAGPPNQDPDPTPSNPSNTEPSNTDPTNANPSNTEPSNTDPTNANPSNTDPTNTEPTGTEPANTDPTNTDPTQPVKVLRTQSITCMAKFTKPIGKHFYLKAKAKTPLAYKTSNKKVATVTGQGLVKITGYGTCRITITAAKSGTYRAAKKVITVNGRLARPTLKGVNVKEKKVKLTWSKVSGASGYKLYIKYPGAKKYALALTKSAKVKGVTHRSLTKGKTYCYKVRAYKKVGKKIVYSGYSRVVKVKIKK